MAVPERRPLSRWRSARRLVRVCLRDEHPGQQSEASGREPREKMGHRASVEAPQGVPREPGWPFRAVPSWGKEARSLQPTCSSPWVGTTRAGSEALGEVFPVAEVIPCPLRDW